MSLISNNVFEPSNLDQSKNLFVMQPKEVLGFIFKNLTLSDIGILAVVCKAFKAALDNGFWKTLVARDFGTVSVKDFKQEYRVLLEYKKKCKLHNVSHFVHNFHIFNSKIVREERYWYFHPLNPIERCIVELEDKKNIPWIFYNEKSESCFFTNSHIIRIMNSNMIIKYDYLYKTIGFPRLSCIDFAPLIPNPFFNTTNEIVAVTSKTVEWIHKEEVGSQGVLTLQANDEKIGSAVVWNSNLYFHVMQVGITVLDLTDLSNRPADSSVKGRYGNQEVQKLHAATTFEGQDYLIGSNLKENELLVYSVDDLSNTVGNLKLGESGISRLHGKGKFLFAAMAGGGLQIWDIVSQSRTKNLELNCPNVISFFDYQDYLITYNNVSIKIVDLAKFEILEDVSQRITVLSYSQSDKDDLRVIYKIDMMKSDLIVFTRSSRPFDQRDSIVDVGMIRIFKLSDFLETRASE